MKYISKYDSPIGQMILSSDGQRLTGLGLSKQKPEETELEKPLKIFDETKKWLDEYFAQKQPNFMPKIDLTGTPFQLQIYKILMQIPYGKTITYGEIADIIAKENGIQKMSAQAVGGAVKSNKIIIIIPCHRVIGKDNKLVGYSAGGIEIKRKLLKIEGIKL